MHIRGKEAIKARSGNRLADSDVHSGDKRVPWLASHFLLKRNQHVHSCLRKGMCVCMHVFIGMCLIKSVLCHISVGDVPSL